jgi:hypothetical protein
MTGHASCDCCGKYRPLYRVWVSGIETFACAQCLDYPPEWQEEEFSGERTEARGDA